MYHVHAHVCMKLCSPAHGESNFKVKGILVQQELSDISRFSLSTWVWSIWVQETIAPLCRECYHSSKLTVVRNIKFSVSRLLHLVQRAIIAVPSLWFCYVWHATMFWSMHILCIYLYQSSSVKNKKKSKIKNNPTDRVKFSGDSRPETRTFFV